MRSRIDSCWRPYHAALDARSTSVIDTFGAVWHVNCHSMPAVGDALADDPGRERADFVLGDRDGTTCEPQFTALVARTLRDAGLHRRDQRSVQGRGARAQARTARERRHSLQIEIKRTLYMDEAHTRAERRLREACERDLGDDRLRSSRATSASGIARLVRPLDQPHAALANVHRDAPRAPAQTGRPRRAFHPEEEP